MELTKADRQIDFINDSGNKDWSTVLKKRGWDWIRIRLFVGKLSWIFEMHAAGLKVEKLGGVVDGAIEW